MDEKEFGRLKREAEQRMKELHAEAAATAPEEAAEPIKEEEKPAAQSGGITEALFRDKDRTLILALLLLLTDEKDGKADYSLLMALLYILL